MNTDVRVSGSLVTAGWFESKNARVYDWTRPDMFSRDQIRALSVLHERFAVGTAGSFPEKMGSCHVCLVDQMTLGDFKASKGKGTVRAAAASADVPSAAGETAPEGRRYFVQSGSAVVRFDEAAAARIAEEARALEASSPFSAILFFARAEGAFASLLSDADVLSGRILPLLRDAWKQRVRMPVLRAMAAGDRDGIPDRAMILLVEFQLGSTDENMIMVYPSDRLQKILHFLS